MSFHVKRLFNCACVASATVNVFCRAPCTTTVVSILALTGMTRQMRISTHDSAFSASKAIQPCREHGRCQVNATAQRQIKSAKAGGDTGSKTTALSAPACPAAAVHLGTHGCCQAGRDPRELPPRWGRGPAASRNTGTGSCRSGLRAWERVPEALRYRAKAQQQRRHAYSGSTYAQGDRHASAVTRDHPYLMRRSGRTSVCTDL